jgi:DNA-directed RNA polymerase subunit RPC12/RpoP
MENLQLFNCPGCGAPLKAQADSAEMIECPYCKSSVLVPQALRCNSVLPGASGESAPIADLIDEVARIAAPLGEIAQLARSGEKLEAIKLYRQTFDVGLQEAKDAVEKIVRGEPVDVSHGKVNRITASEPIVLTHELTKASASVQVETHKRPNLKSCLPQGLAMIAILGLFFLIFYTVGILPMKLNPVYRTAMEMVKQDAAVKAIFGSPVRDGWIVLGTIDRFLDGSELVDLKVSLRGPRSSGVMHIYGEKEKDGTISISSIWIEIEGTEVLEYDGSEPQQGFQPSSTVIRMKFSPQTPIP